MGGVKHLAELWTVISLIERVDESDYLTGTPDGLLVNSIMHGPFTSLKQSNHPWLPPTRKKSHWQNVQSHSSDDLTMKMRAYGGSRPLSNVENLPSVPEFRKRKKWLSHRQPEIATRLQFPVVWLSPRQPGCNFWLSGCPPDNRLVISGCLIVPQTTGLQFLVAHNLSQFERTACDQ